MERPAGRRRWRGKPRSGTGWPWTRRTGAPYLAGTRCRIGLRLTGVPYWTVDPPLTGAPYLTDGTPYLYPYRYLTGAGTPRAVGWGASDRTAAALPLGMPCHHWPVRVEWW
jgi:hypothetical protein